MQITAKKILGWIGLASVAATTIFAYNIPNPAVATTTQTDTIQVTVHEKSSVVIQQPKDASDLTSSIVTVETDFADAALVKHYLSDPAIGLDQVLIDTYIPSEDITGISEGYVVCPYSKSYLCTGTRTFTFNLDDYTGGDHSYGHYTIKAEIFDSYVNNPITNDVEGNGDVAEDSTAFTYRPLTAAITNKEANYDPIITANADTNVKYLLVQAYNPDGTPLFANGPVRIEQEVIPGGTFNFSLPFTANGAVYETTYRIVISSYDASGTLLYGENGAVELSYRYDNKPVPIPNTGSLFLDNLNISRSDFLITGLLIFTVVAGFSIFLIVRKKHRR